MEENNLIFNDDDFSWIDSELKSLNDIDPDIEKYSRVHSGRILNIFEFNNKYLGYKLYPREITSLKLIYGLSLDGTDKEELMWLEKNKGLKIKEKSDGYNEIVFVMGRKAGKSAFSASIIAMYELYRMHRIYDPQKHFDLLPHSPISVVICSASGDQAEEMHRYLSASLKNCIYFNNFVSHYGKKEISILTQEEKKNNIKEGSIKIHTLHSLSRTIRTYNAFLIFMDELAHMIDNKGVYSGGALYKALTPSISLFKKWGRVFSLSSPLGESGQLYELYKLSQDENIKNIIVFQYASWDFNPKLKKQDFEEEYIKDPESADMEYGGNFGKVTNAYLPTEKIDIMFKEDREIAKFGNLYNNYVVTIDPSKNNDKYVLCVAHKEIRQINGVPIIFKIMDLLRYWEAEIIKNDKGDFQRLPIRVKDVEDYVVNLPKRAFKIGMIAYDQFNSMASIQKFQDMNFNATETTFTNKYKEAIYTNLRDELVNETIECYTKEELIEDKVTAAGQARIELKSIQRTLKGKTIHIGHPVIGPVQNDDFADAIANACYLLSDIQIANKIETTSVKPMVSRVGIG